MKIEVERSGCFAGIKPTTYSIDENPVTSVEAHQLEELLEKASFFNMPSKFPSTKRGADYCTYRITVQKEGRQHTVTATDITMPADLRHIIESIINLNELKKTS